MATNVTEKDKTLNEIIGMCVEKRIHYRQFLNDFMLTHSEDWHDSADVTYGERIMFLRGKIQAFDECAACCESMLGYSGSMPSEVPNPKRGREMSAYQPVLDPACGGRMFWFDKSDDRVLFGDVRDESWELCDGRRFDVKPDMLMDYRDLPFPDGTFRMVVLDPPHLRNAGETSYMAQKYGCLDQETWKADLKTMFSECFRVLKEHGVLIFKWNETQIPVSQILKLTAHKPLFGNKQPNRTGTHWIVFMKEDAK